jgi:hypothetical protein
MRTIVADEDPGFVVVGGVPKDWRAQRQLITVEAMSPLPSVDVEHPTTHEYLTAVLAPQLEARGSHHFDVAAVLSGDIRSEAFAKRSVAPPRSSGNPRSRPEDTAHRR